MLDKDGDGKLDANMKPVRDAASLEAGYMLGAANSIIADIGCTMTGSMLSTIPYMKGCVSL